MPIFSVARDNTDMDVTTLIWKTAIMLVFGLIIAGLLVGIAIVLFEKVNYVRVIREKLFVKLWVAISIAIAAVMLAAGLYLTTSFSGFTAEEPLPARKIPQFPWPPPKASAFEVIPRELLVPENQTVLLDDVNDSLDKAFRECGYGDKSDYAVPDGFAIASRIEQINPDGTPAADRWSVNASFIKEFSLRAYLSALFTAGNPGHYRIIVFIITPHPFVQADVEVSPPEAQKWVKAGWNLLPAEIGSHEYSSDYNCTALIYEFQRVGINATRFVEPSEMTGRLHLEKAGLLTALSRHP